MKKAVILLSGGLDSATCMAMAKDQGFEIYAISFHYNQRHDVEVKSAENVALISTSALLIKVVCVFPWRL